MTAARAIRSRRPLPVFGRWLCLVAAAAVLAAGDRVDEPIQPLPQVTDLDHRKVALGRQLFHDPGLSANGRISCASCHDLQGGGVAPGQTHAPPGVSGRAVAINVPTVFNAGFNYLQFWDGRAQTLEDQIDGPIHNPDEMGLNWPAVLKVLRADRAYRRSFQAAYGGPPSERTVKDAIATYERSLVTPDAPFDRYLKGDRDALGAEALRGYELFKSYGCASCHQGVNVGGNMLQVFGVVDNYFKARGNITEHDLGRYNVTGDDYDRHVFKVPSLRNVALTAPYFHDGSAATLDEAVDIMARYQLGRQLGPPDRAALVAFLESLTGVYKEWQGDDHRP